MKSKVAGLIVCAIWPAASPLHAADILSSKRGFADTGAYYGDIQATNAGWYYNWGTAPSNIGNYNANFYSMIWGSGQSSDGTINYALSVTSQYLLGFNEPERSDQSNLTVSQATSIWDRMYTDTVAYNSAHGTSIKLVSPAVSDTGAGEAWLQSFMATESSKVDAVAFHWYDDSTTDGAQAASDFEYKVQWYHNTFNKPVFITEFANHDWSGSQSQSAMIAANTQMLSIVVPWLESQSYVVGYSWYNWFSDSALFSTTGSTLTPTQLGWNYNGAIASGSTVDLAGQDIGEHVADLTGGTLTMSSAGTVRYINALSGTSYITGTVNWGLNASTNWARIQSGATLDKTGSNTITFIAPVSNDGTLQVAQGVLSLNSAMSGTGSLYISSTGDSTGSTARFELNGNINIPHPITFAQRTDPGNSDGIRNVSGNNTLSGPMTITVGGNQARIESDAGLLTLAGPVSTNATSARNLYLQGNGNGVVSGVISNNPSNANGTINLYKQGSGTWTLTAANSYGGNTTISAGTLQLAQISSSTVAATAVANYTFDNVSGSTVVNSGTGGAGMNGALVNGATVVSGGRFGNALSLASGAYLNINSFITSMGNTGNWSVAAWVKTSTPGGTILSKSINGSWSNGNSIFYLGDGSGAGAGGIPSAVRYAGGFYQASTAGTSVTDNNWHLVTYVNNAGNYAIYVDGAAQSLADGYNGFSNNDSSSTVRIGATTDNVASDGTVNFNGLLDNVQIYSQALTAPQIAALYLTNTTGLLPSSTNVSISAGATLDVNGTVQQIAGLTGAAGSAVTLGSGQLTINSSSNTQFAGTISGNGGSIVKQGSGFLTLSSANNYSGGTTVTSGGLIAANPYALGTGGLTIHSSGNVQLQGGLGKAVVLPSLTFDGSPGNWLGSLDLTNNKLIVEAAVSHASALANLQSQAHSVLTSSTMAANYGIAVIDNSALANPFATFGGQNVDANSILVSPELLGDANADGHVDLTDLSTVLNNFGTSTAAWTSGNFDGAPTIDLTDLSAVLNNFGLTNPSATAIASAAITIPTPEPTSLSLLLPATLLLRRKR
ncbi:MAG TPA: glycosyl hydrolase [Phycisphaerae bacterium]|nr:glycosyl hydrolase [Phycisphaerae bacterium]